MCGPVQSLFPLRPFLTYEYVNILRTHLASLLFSSGPFLYLDRAARGDWPPPGEGSVCRPQINTFFLFLLPHPPLDPTQP